MTEQEWLTSTNPRAMLAYLTGGASTREPFRAAPAVYVDQAGQRLELASDRKLRLACNAVFTRTTPSGNLRRYETVPKRPMPWLAGFFSGGESAIQQRLHALGVAVLRDVFGNPFRPVTIATAWLSWDGGAAPALARAIYVERAFDRCPILADILEEAGCADADLLGHLRSPGPHVRGCWAVDLLLGKA